MPLADLSPSWLRTWRAGGWGCLLSNGSFPRQGSGLVCECACTHIRVYTDTPGFWLGHGDQLVPISTGQENTLTLGWTKARHEEPLGRPQEPCSWGGGTQEAREQGHGKRDLAKTLPAGRVENGLANARMSFSHIWFHIWSQPIAYFKALTRPALIASGSGLRGDTVPAPSLHQMVAHFSAVVLCSGHTHRREAGEGFGAAPGVKPCPGPAVRPRSLPTRPCPAGHVGLPPAPPPRLPGPPQPPVGIPVLAGQLLSLFSSSCTSPAPSS